MRHLPQIWARDTVAPALGTPPLALLLSVRRLDPLGWTRAQGALLLGLHPRKKPLPFADALDLDGDRVETLIDARESVVDLLRHLGDCDRAATPDATRVRDRKRQADNEHEERAQGVRLFRRPVPRRRRRP